jgi:hypothetical protein
MKILSQKKCSTFLFSLTRTERSKQSARGLRSAGIRQGEDAAAAVPKSTRGQRSVALACTETRRVGVVGRYQCASQKYRSPSAVVRSAARCGAESSVQCTLLLSATNQITSQTRSGVKTFGMIIERQLIEHAHNII